MIKIHNMANLNQVFDAISNGFLDYVPGDKFREVADINDADIVFLAGALSQGRLEFRMPQGLTPSFENMKTLADLYNALADKPRIIWLDTMGPDLYHDPALLDTETSGLTEKDVLVSPASLPPFPNLFTDVSHIEKSVFRPRSRFERVKSSVVMIYDQIVNAILDDVPVVDVLSDVMDVVSHLHITKTQTLRDDVVAGFGESLSRVSYENLSYPQGVAYKLSQVEFALITSTRVGIEMMGVEAGMSGCQPIYPDTEFYRDIFDGTGVAFFDIKNPVESLRDIIQAGSNFDAKTTEAFRTKFSAEDTLPGFWDAVYALYAEE
ncbi:hypothetical protein F4Z99_10665 [Candidatus Poribacteria bacterium]|nr:hypothetical protein [Candidatus Poribacteria bacterium]